MCARTLTLDEAIAQAKAGMPQVQWSLALLYATGKASVESDPQQALYWCNQAAENGHPYAQYNLAKCYEIGLFVSQDSTQAAYWLNRADTHPALNKPLSLVQALQPLVPPPPSIDLSTPGPMEEVVEYPEHWDTPPSLQNAPMQPQPETVTAEPEATFWPTTPEPQELAASSSDEVFYPVEASPERDEEPFTFEPPLQTLPSQQPTHETSLTESLAATYSFMPDPVPEPEPEPEPIPLPEAVPEVVAAEPEPPALPPLDAGAIEDLFSGAEALMHQGDEAAGAEQMLLAARYGHAKAQFTYAHCLEFGIGVLANLKEAAYWYREAVDQGLSDAMINLGAMIEDGRGVMQNLHRAAELYQLAAEQGDYRGMNNLALLYQFGKGLAKDSTKAIEWFEKAAQLGDTGAMINLGTMWERGDGIDASFEKALQYYQMAAENGNPRAQLILGKIYLNGNAHIQPDALKAGQWLAQSADQNNADAQYELGRLFERGTENIPPNAELAAEWYQLAATQGQSEAQYALIFFCGKGLGGLEVDPAEAYKWAILAAEKNTLNADELRDEIGAAITPEELLDGKQRAERWKQDFGWKVGF